MITVMVLTAIMSTLVVVATQDAVTRLLLSLRRPEAVQALGAENYYPKIVS